MNAAPPPGPPGGAPPPALPRITSPQSAQVVGVDSHLPPIEADRLQAQAVRERLAALDLQRFQPEFAGDGGRLFPERVPKPAAVLVPLVQRPQGLQVLLTERTSHLRDHAGQISFPGGGAEPDDGDAITTALREAEEEVGLARRHVDVLGQLPTYSTVTRYLVTPVVALVTPPFDLQLDDFEVAEAFEVPLAFLMDPANHRRHAVDVAGIRRHFLSMPWRRDAESREYFIWGATAAMLRNLYRALA